MKVSTVYASVRLLANVLGMMPLHMYQRTDDGKMRDDRHRLARPLRVRPNPWQTAFQWRSMMMGHLVLRGNAYSLVQNNPRGVELWPLHPDYMEVEDQNPDGTIQYRYRPPNQPERSYNSARDLFTLTGFSNDGVTGVSVIAMMRDAVGGAIATQDFASRLFKDAPMFKGLLKQMAGKYMNETDEQRLTGSFARAHSGPNAHGVALLPPGLEWEQVGMTPEDSQFLETRAFQVEDLLRFLGVPGVLVGHADKTATYASAEQFFQSFFTYHMAPWFTLWEQVILRDLVSVVEQDTVFAEFAREGLLRGDSTARANFYRTMIELGIMTRNEARERESLNKIPGLDEPLTPRNMQMGPDAEPPPEPPEGGRLEAMLDHVSDRLTRKEVLALTRAGKRLAGKPDAWKSYVADFYEKFHAEIAAECAVDPDAVSSYVAERCHAVRMGGLAVVAQWEAARGAELAGLVKGLDA